LRRKPNDSSTLVADLKTSRNNCEILPFNEAQGAQRVEEGDDRRCILCDWDQEALNVNSSHVDISVRVEFFKFDHPLHSVAGTSLTHARLDRTSKYQVFGLPCSAPGFGPLSSHLPKLGSSASRDTRVIILSTERKEITMARGTVKWFNPTKGYGFIQPQGGGREVFVHISAVEKAGLNTLNEGQIVQYEIVSNRGKESADNLKVG